MGSRGLIRTCLGVVQLIRFRVGSFGRAYWSSGLLGLAWVYSGVIGVAWCIRWFTQVRLGVVGFIRVHLGSLCRACVSSRSFVLSLAPTARLGVAVFIRDGVGCLGRNLSSWGSFAFMWVYSGAPRSRVVHSGSRGFIRAGLGVLALIRFRVGSLRCDWDRRFHSRGITRKGLGIIRVRALPHYRAPRGRRCIPICVCSLRHTHWESGSYRLQVGLLRRAYRSSGSSGIA